MLGFNYLTSTTRNAYLIKLTSPLAISQYGLYNGIINKEPSIKDISTQIFKLAKGSNITLATTKDGSIRNDTGVKLEVLNGVQINWVITVLTYNAEGALNPI